MSEDVGEGWGLGRRLGGRREEKLEEEGVRWKYIWRWQWKRWMKMKMIKEVHDNDKGKEVRIKKYTEEDE